jgi:predicted permease
MSLASDFRHAIRLLARSPIFTITAVLSLAVGVAGSAAVFSLADALLLRPRVGVTDPKTLVDIGRTTDGEGFDNFGYPLFVTLRQRTTMLEGMSAHRLAPDVMSLGDAESSERVFAALVSGTYFSVVGARPAQGRFFISEEDLTPDTHPVAVLSHAFWIRRFAGNPSIVGQTLRLNSRRYTVIGVAEEGFTGTTFTTADFWVPMAMDAHVRANDRSLRDEHGAVWLTALARLKPGVSPEQAREELQALTRSYLNERGDPRRDRWGIDMVQSARLPTPLAAPVIGFIAVLGALTGLVLLIACSNVAAMLLARALERRREVATRLAIGASRGRIMLQLLVEGLTLAILAGLLSVPLAISLVSVLTSFQPSIPIPLALELRVDPRVMLFAFALAATTAILFALLPALQATRFEMAAALHGAHSTSDRRRAWLRHGLVASQVAMALLLLVAAGLFLRSLQRAATMDAGFNPENVDLIQIDPRIAGYQTDADGLRLASSLVDRFRRVPGVEAVGASRMVPLMGGGLGLGRLSAPGYLGSDGDDSIEADWDVVTPGYFEALQVSLSQGRLFTDKDREGAPFVAIINETMATRVWPGQNPIGRHLLQQTGRDRNEVRTLEIVGVARNAKHRFFGEPPVNFIYVPIAQQFLSELTFYVRRAGSGSRISELRKVVASLDPNLPVIHAQTMKDATAIGLLPQRLAAWIAGSVGAIGLLLAALGLYGLTSFSVAQRTRELAVRMALGASRRSLLSLVLGQASRLALIGAAIGFALAMAASRLLNSLLIGLGPVDPMAFGAATILLIVVLLVASWVPANRAAHMDPMRALRAE